MKPRIVITGVGLTSPIGDDLATYRQSLLSGRPGVEWTDLRYIGRVPAGICHFDVARHQKRKDARRGTRAGSIAIYCAREALAHAGLDPDALDGPRTGVYVGITEHGTVETENEIANLKEFDYDVSYWTHHHNPRSIANNPAGETCLNLGITGPHCTIGAACAAGNYGLIHGAQQLILGEVDRALAGGVSESVRSFGIFAGFKSQNALASHEDPARASRPFDTGRNGIVVAEGGCLYVLERLEDAQARGAPVLAEIAGWAVNTDATDFVLPNPERQAECMQRALAHAGLAPGEVDLVSTHATGTPEGDPKEIAAIRAVFGEAPRLRINNTKSFFGHAMGAAGALELAGNLPGFTDGMVHPTVNVDELDPACAHPGLVIGEPCRAERMDVLLNNSFGMLGINAVLIVTRYPN